MFYEFETLVNGFLCNKAQLIVGRFVHKFLKCLFLIKNPGHIKVNSPIHFIIGYTSLDDVILRIIVFAAATTAHKIKPFLIIGIKSLDFKFRVRFKIKNVENSIIPNFQKPVGVCHCLLLESGHIETLPKVKRIARMQNVWSFKALVGSMID